MDDNKDIRDVSRRVFRILYILTTGQEACRITVVPSGHPAGQIRPMSAHRC
ncbi:hypothetical protein [Streptomyces sp. NPDC024089]|uniref:hypothetical protein n=1 Tax=Streptomyces sp. NPDC024089 TaxID=3154328 RepID=UPI0033E3868B